MKRIGRSGVGFEGVDPRVLFIPSCPGYTGLTSALDWSDRCEPFVGFALGELLNPCVFGLCWCWSILGCFGCVLLGFVKCKLCFGGVLVPRPREVTEALWNICCAATAATGLTGAGHLYDWCGIGSKPCKFLLCVLVCFGSEGCLLVPSISSTPVATWS
jgi:hypothetical protein